MKRKSKKQYGWHFCGDTLLDGRPVPDEGVWLEHEGAIKMCETGLHGSRTPFDALKYAPGTTLCYCEFEGIEAEDKYKFVARRRKIIANGDATEALRFFARHQALSVIHLWDAPDVVCDYLMGDDAAWAAARAAARDAAWAAASAEAWDAVSAEAWDAASAEAWAAARDAARDAVSAEAWDAVSAEARDAAWAAASAEAWDAAWAAASAEARAAALAEAKKYFNDLIYECFEDVL
jgi:hypothetical protein